MENPSKQRALRKSPFLEWCDSEGLKVATGYGIKDLRTLPLEHWERLGGPAAYCHLEGSQGIVGALAGEIPPGKSLRPIRHMYEEQILILEGRGATQFWSDGDKQAVTLEWQAGSLFSPPLNVRHQHFNGSSLEPVRFVAVNNAPLIVNVYKLPDFIFSAPYDFSNRFSGQRDFFSSDFKPSDLEDKAVNFIPDVYAVPLNDHPDRGVGFSRLGIHLSGNSMVGHIMAIQSGTYKKAHRHHSGAQVIVLGGKGYSLMWPPGGKFVRVDWEKGSLLVPPEGWYLMRVGCITPPATAPHPDEGSRSRSSHRFRRSPPGCRCTEGPHSQSRSRRSRRRRFVPKSCARRGAKRPRPDRTHAPRPRRMVPARNRPQPAATRRAVTRVVM